MRLDIWLWSSRMVKTRSKATSLCKGGKVTVNSSSAKPARKITVGDMVSVQYPGYLKVYRVLALADIRGNAREAAELFEDMSPPREQFDFSRVAPLGGREKGAGRPTKKDRRSISEFTKK